MHESTDDVPDDATIQELKNELYREAWKYQSSILGDDENVCIAVMIEIGGKREVYMSRTQDKWPFSLQVRFLSKLVL